MGGRKPVFIVRLIWPCGRMCRPPQNVIDKIKGLPMVAGLRNVVFAALSAIVLAVAPASAQNTLGIDAFYGQWQGSAVSESEISVYFQLTARDIGVTVRPAGEGKFELSWATIQRQKGNPDNPVEELKATTVVFERRNDGLWWDVESGSPSDGGLVRWARIEENVLIVNAFTIRPDGTSEIQTYRRAITDRGMELEFSRTLDGALVRTAKGQLVKIAQ